jgi:hypothetical protein
LDNSGTDDPGLIYLGGLVGAWWFSGVALCCGGPFGFLLGAYVGAELVVNEPTNGEDNSQKVERLFEKIDHLADLEPRLTEAEINEEIEAYRREKRG